MAINGEPTGFDVRQVVNNCLVLDFETTGTNPRHDVPVQVGIQTIIGGERFDEYWYVNPGRDIPEEAAKVHGITADMVADGESIHDSVTAIIGIINDMTFNCGMDVPVVIYNAHFDWQMFMACAVRERLWRHVPRLPLLDPLVLDRHFNRYRRGGRQLETLCAAYHVDIDNAHDAAADALATYHLLCAMVERYGDVINEHAYSMWELHYWQAKLWQEWKRGLNDYWKRKNIDRRINDTHWPGT